MESSEVQEKGGASGRVLKEGWGRAAAAGAARRHFPSAGDGGWRREGGGRKMGLVRCVKRGTPASPVLRRHKHTARAYV